MRISEKIGTRICFPKKSPVLGRCAASDGFRVRRKKRLNKEFVFIGNMYIYVFLRKLINYGPHPHPIPPSQVAF